VLSVTYAANPGTYLGCYRDTEAHDLNDVKAYWDNDFMMEMVGGVGQCAYRCLTMHHSTYFAVQVRRTLYLVIHETIFQNRREI